MAEIILKTDNPEGVTELVKRAIASELYWLERNQQIARKRLDYFEGKYQQRSSQLKERLAAEDLEGGDLEYVEWMGEYQLFLDLEEKIESFKTLEYIRQ